MKRIEAGVLDVAYLETGPADGEPIILLHGFPYDVHAYDTVAEHLATAGRRCITPYLRGYGPTPLSIGRHAPIRGAGGIGCRSAGLDGRAGPAEGGACGI